MWWAGKWGSASRGAECQAVGRAGRRPEPDGLKSHLYPCSLCLCFSLTSDFISFSPLVGWPSSQGSTQLAPSAPGEGLTRFCFNCILEEALSRRSSVGEA